MKPLVTSQNVRVRRHRPHLTVRRPAGEAGCRRTTGAVAAWSPTSAAQRCPQRRTQPSPSAAGTRTVRPRPGCWWQQDDGAAATETVIITPVLLLLLLLIVQFALALHAQHIAQTAASRALAAARAQGSTAAAGQAQAAATLAALGRGVLLDPKVTVHRTAGSSTTEVRGFVESVVPGLHLPITARAAGPVEHWSKPNTGHR